MTKCLRYDVNITIAARWATSDDRGQCSSEIFDRSKVIKCNDFVFKTNERRLIQEVLNWFSLVAGEA